MSEADALRRKAARERRAREEAERLLEQKSRELYYANESLTELAEQLEQRVQDRTHELQKASDAAVEAREEALEASRQAERANHAKSLFLANMSHEIRSPIAAVTGYVDLLSHVELPDDAAHEWMSGVARNVTHLLSLLDDVLDMSRIEAGRIDLCLGPVNPAQIAKSIVELREAPSSVILLAQIAPGVPELIESDGARLRQILFNLVGNALKATIEGQVVVRLNCLGENLRFEVEDTGVGIRPDRLDAIWEPFEQAHTAGDWESGAGLGLHISRQLARAMGGDMGVRSTVGTGTTVWLDLPANVGIESIRSTSERVLDLSGIDVVLVDDTDDIRRLYAHYVSSLGARVEAFSDGHAAIDRLTRGPLPHVVLADLHMPHIGGLELIRTLRDAGLSVPVVAVSADATLETRHRAAEAGMASMVLKPCTAADLGTAIVNAHALAEVPAAPLLAQRDLPPDLIAMFLDDLQKQREQLRAALDDVDETRRIAHRIAGAGSSYGFPELTDTARRVETDGTMRDVDALLDAIEVALERTTGRHPHSGR